MPYPMMNNPAMVMGGGFSPRPIGFGAMPGFQRPMAPLNITINHFGGQPTNPMMGNPLFSGSAFGNSMPSGFGGGGSLLDASLNNMGLGAFNGGGAGVANPMLTNPMAFNPMMTMPSQPNYMQIIQQQQQQLAAQQQQIQQMQQQLQQSAQQDQQQAQLQQQQQELPPPPKKTNWLKIGGIAAGGLLLLNMLKGKNKSGGEKGGTGKGIDFSGILKAVGPILTTVLGGLGQKN